MGTAAERRTAAAGIDAVALAAMRQPDAGGTRQRVRTACRPSGLFFFCRDLSSGPDPPDFAPDFALDSALDSAPDHKNSDLLALAETSHAEFLMTGDRERLFLKHHKSTRIVAAAMIEVL